MGLLIKPPKHKWPPANPDIQGLLFGGKATVDPSGCVARWRLFWVKESRLSKEAIKDYAAVKMVMDSYPEAVRKSIRLWAVPEDEMAVDVTFDIDLDTLRDRQRPKVPLYNQYIQTDEWTGV